MGVNTQVLPGTTKDTRMAAVLPLSGAAAGQFIVMLTRGGWIKKTPMAEFADERAPKRNGKIAMKVEAGDELVRGTCAACARSMPGGCVEVRTCAFAALQY